MRAILGLGSNLGAREAFLRATALLLHTPPRARLVARSRVFDTAPIGGQPQPRFLNAAVVLETSFEPFELLEHVQRVERSLGRVRGERWGPRTIDVDILYMDGVELEREALTIPHASLEARAFALAPLLDVAPDLAPRYAPILARLGGVPERSSLFRPRPISQVEPGGGIAISAEGSDEADALSAALTGLFERIQGGYPETAREVRSLALSSGDLSPEAALVREATYIAAAGFEIAEVVIAALDRTRVTARLVGKAGTGTGQAFREAEVLLEESARTRALVRVLSPSIPAG